VPTAALLGLGLLGLAILTVSADQLVVGSSRLAVTARVRPVVVGVVIIGLGTSTPEFLVSGLAAAGGRGGLALGNLIGSNVVNVTLILGVAALVAPVAVRSTVPAREAPLTLVAVAAFGALALLGLAWLGGTLLAVLLVLALLVLVRLSRTRPSDPLSAEVVDHVDGQPDNESGPRWLPESARTALGLAGTLGGAQLVVSTAGTLASRWGVSDAVIGFTLVALGTSLPELVTAIQAQRRREADLLVGNLLGSNLFNSLAGGAIVGLATGTRPIGVGYPIVAAMVGANLLAWLLLFRGYRVTRLEGTVLIGAYLATLPLLT
jgi:cation:H+ antiporter